ncbi:MAG: hypothetical protein UZ22_OP11002000440 [Microgenomates bacterium OLB23]|nr:MAG: hypothetical protein UZ22_OP11002000440 [Microgenomates bacterium OLB23]
MKRSYGRERSIQGHVIAVIGYFHHFDYAPSEAHIHMFMPIKVSKTHLQQILTQLVRQKKLIRTHSGMPPDSIYAMGGHSILFKKRAVRKAQTDKMLSSLSTYSHMLYLSPWIKMVGISGSCSMDNAKGSDDVDFFIITAANRLWLARLWAITAAKILGVHRRRSQKRVTGKACLNMFFDESDLLVPHAKQNLYTGHEVAQMRLINMRRGAYYQRLFLQSNKWIRHYFPNISIRRNAEDISPSYKEKNSIYSIVGGLMEWFAKELQLHIMRAHITHEIITKRSCGFSQKTIKKKLEKLV